MQPYQSFSPLPYSPQSILTPSIVFHTPSSKVVKREMTSTKFYFSRLFEAVKA